MYIFTYSWVCYAEKKSHLLVPCLSTTRSAQQIISHLLRVHLPSILGIAENELFIVTVMSCYDRKLEASRRDFRRASGVVDTVDCNEKEKEEKRETSLPLHDVDCVLSSQEIFELITSTTTSSNDNGNDNDNGNCLSSSYQIQWEQSWLYPYCEQSTAITTNWNEPLTSSGSILYALIQSELEKHPSAQLQ